ncbi:MAG: hypothetical protein ACI93E_001241 [Flavobacteriales bacterium]|jgi:hypothetical protein
MLLRLLLTTIALTFSQVNLVAQHSWDNPLKNTSSDMSAVLHIEMDDQVCISSFQAINLPDSTGAAIAKHFAKKLVAIHPKSNVQFPCTDTLNNFVFVTGTVEQTDNGIRTAINAESPERINDWTAVFFLENTAHPIYNAADEQNEVFFIVPELPAKSTIQRMSGHTIDCTLLGAEGIELVYEITKRNGKKKQMRLHRSEVFSVIFNEGEWVLYEKDEVLGDDLSEDEMRVFIAGAKDAIAHYNAKPTTYVGVLVGAAGPIIAGGGVIVTLAPIIIYTLLQLAPIIKIKGVSNPDHIDNETYALGYASVARSEKILGGLKGSAAGAAAGLAAYLILR